MSELTKNEDLFWDVRKSSADNRSDLKIALRLEIMTLDKTRILLRITLMMNIDLRQQT